MIRVICYGCDKELNEPGALLISPPAGEGSIEVGKFHICRECYFWLTVKLLELWKKE